MATDSASRGDSGEGPALAWVVPVLAFLAGCLLSGTAVALVLSDGGDEGTAASAADAGLHSERGASPPTDVVVRVPESCLEAAAGALEAGREAEQAVAALRDLDPRRLQEIVERFRREQPGLQQAAQRCRDATDQRIEDGVRDSAAPAPTG